MGRGPGVAFHFLSQLANYFQRVMSGDGAVGNPVFEKELKNCRNLDGFHNVAAGIFLPFVWNYSTVHPDESFIEGLSQVGVYEVSR